MIIMKKGATAEEIAGVVNDLKSHGLSADVSRGEIRTVIGIIGDESRISAAHLETLPGVKEVRLIETPYKLINREYSTLFDGKTESRVVKVGAVKIGNSEPVFIAGPCAIESKVQLMRIAAEVKAAGADILRGGVFKPRTSVHSFQGLGSSDEGAEQALGWLREAGDKYDIPVITEVRGESHVNIVAKYADILQIGSRNMYNQDLLIKVAKTGKPVLLKRHFGASIEEFLSFAEYIAASGNKDIILCERGIVPVGRGKSYTRYVLDLQAVPVIQKETYLPIIVDPSHAAGRKDLITTMSMSAIAAGASGLEIEVHYNAKEARCDNQQMITAGELGFLIQSCRKLNQTIREYKEIEAGKQCMS
ncbi:MAG: 3-deoxy-7-phosphoheptulonate synthase [Dehalococcoidales bacterium]|jgi:3-deoxy-7-phosphoheptulonate synthase|nr:3-deoxy-7-phosphoheptulonate synthase [Dehalococcoidales bacterium]